MTKFSEEFWTKVVTGIIAITLAYFQWQQSIAIKKIDETTHQVYEMVNPNSEYNQSYKVER